MSENEFAFIAGLLAICIIALPVYAQRPWLQSQGGVLVFYDQLSTAMSDEQCQFVATHACGTQKEPLSFINRVRAYNSNFLLLHYELSFGAGNLLNLEGESWVADWDSVNPHENWFVHDCFAHRCHQTDWDWDYMDPSGSLSGAGSNGWKEYWARRAIRRMSLNDCDGIFSDSHGIPWNMNYEPCGYETTAALGLGPHFVTFDDYQLTHLHAEAEQFKFIPNLGQMFTGWDMTDYSHCDGAMIELFGMDWNAVDHYDPADWELEVDRVLRLANMNKILIFQNNVDYWSPENRSFLVACYYIMKNSRSYINLIFPDWCNDGMDPNWLAEFQINMGNFVGPIPTSAADMYNDDWDVYVRYYERGMVIVNNAWATANVSFPGTYYRVSCTGGGCVGESGIYDDSISITFTSTTGFSMPEMTAAIVTYTNDPMTSVNEGETKEKALPQIFSVAYSNSVLNVLKNGLAYSGSLRICDLMGRNIHGSQCINGSMKIPSLSVGTYFAIAPGLPAAKFIVLR